MSAATQDQIHYQFQSDGADANTSGLLGSEDVANTALVLDTTYFIRIKVAFGGMTAADTWQLEYNVGGAGWVNVTTTSSNVRAVDGSDTDGDAMATERLTNDGGTYDTGSPYEESGITPSGHGVLSEETEFVYAIQFRSADLTAGSEQIDLKVTKAGTDLTTYTVTAEATMPAIASDPAITDVDGDEAAEIETKMLDGGVEFLSSTTDEGRPFFNDEFKGLVESLSGFVQALALAVENVAGSDQSLRLRARDIGTALNQYVEALLLHANSPLQVMAN